MEIAEIKEKLSIGQVLEHYGLQANKNKMLCCPFHDDKNPSMQVYPETNTVHCFSGNCEHTGKAIDQIDFILHKEKCTKHEAISKAKSLLGFVEPVKAKEDLNEIFHQLKANLSKRRNSKLLWQKFNERTLLLREQKRALSKLPKCRNSNHHFNRKHHRCSDRK